jgi:uncharacterized membrane protein YkoI
MQLKNLFLIATLAVSSVPIPFTALADEGGEEHEKVVKLEDIPAPARKTILKEARGAPILKVEEEKEKGKTVYEATVKKGNDEIGIVVDAQGKLINKHSEKNEHEK